MDERPSHGRRAKTGFTAALLVALVLAGGGAAQPEASAPPPAGFPGPRATGASVASAALPAPPRPAIAKRLIPYGAKRKRDMAAYSKRHYGSYKWRLRAPKLIVEHYAVAGSLGSIYNTFAPNRPDPEYGELPGVCSHFAVGADGTIVKFVRTDTRCRHVVGLNQAAIGIEHVGFSDADVLGRPAQLEASLALTDWLRCRFGIGVKGVIGHSESLSSPFYRELDPDFRGRTHGDFRPSSMRTYRGRLRSRAAC